MIQTSLNLYEHFGLPKVEGARGQLLCWGAEKIAAVTQNRRRPAVLIIPGGGYAMHGAGVRKTNAFEFNPTSRVVKNFPSRMKTKSVTLTPYDNPNDACAIRALIVYPPACELFCKQKDESVLSAVGMRVGRTEVQTLTSFCEFLSAK